jgi:hypothetical protein
VHKHNGNHWSKDHKDMNARNQGLHNHTIHRAQNDARKLEEIRKTRLLGDHETKRKTENNEKEFLKKHRKEIR